MLLIRSPTLLFAFTFLITSICLAILTFNIPNTEAKNLIQLLIICPPLNSIFVFLFAATWIERHFRLSYFPFICLIILLSSCILLTVISSLFLSTSIILYINLIYHGFYSLLFLTIIIVTIISYFYGSLCIHRYRNMMTNEQQNSEILQELKPLHVDELLLKSSDDQQLMLFMSILPGRRIRHDIRRIEDDLNHLSVDTIITLNESKELSFMDMTNKNVYNMHTYSTHVKRANIEHIKYPIRDRFIPKSISEYIQFVYGVIIHANSSQRHRILVHCMGGMGRTGMTIVCFKLVYEYLTKDNHQSQNFIERICHYPILFTKFCRVCQAISDVRQARPGSIYNPIQIMFAHEFYARLKSSSYMEQIKQIFSAHENSLLSTTSNHHFSI